MTTQDHVVGPDGHVDVDVLSDLVEGLLPPEAARAAEVHVASCADCRDTRDALREVRELLGGHTVEPMPDEVFAGIQEALARAAAEDARGDLAEPPSAAVVAPLPVQLPVQASPDLGALPPPVPRTRPEPPAEAPVIPLDRARRRRNRVLMAVAAAAAAAVLGVSLLTGPSDSDTSADSSTGVSGPVSEEQMSGAAPSVKSSATPPAAAAPGAQDNSEKAAAPSTGTEYTRTNIGSLARQLLTRQALTSGATTGGAGPAPRTDSAPGAAPGGKSSVAVLPVCVRNAVGTGTPLAAEQGRFEGRAVYVVVQPTADPRNVQVTVVDAACAALSTASDTPQTTRAPTEPAASLAATEVLYRATVPLG